MDGVFCQRILRATKEIPYVNSSDSYDLFNKEPSTPEHAIDSPGISHLAEEELSFTDDDMNAITLQNIQYTPPLHKTVCSAVSNEKAAKIVYSEAECDNSCVVSLDNSTKMDEEKDFKDGACV